MGDSLIGGEEIANQKLRNGIIVLAVGAIIWFMPVPGGLTAQAWRLFAVFVATILGFILHPLPLGAMAFVALTVCALTNPFTAPDIARMRTHYERFALWVKEQLRT